MAQRLKKCNRCKSDKPFKAFRKCKSAKDGRYWWCSQCCSEYKKGRKRQRKRRTKEEIFTDLLKNKYGLTIDAFEAMLQNQNRVCAICGNSPNGNGPVNSRFNIDHCYKSGQVRAFLCCRYNNPLGLAGDDIGILENCIEYLQRWGDDL